MLRALALVAIGILIMPAVAVGESPISVAELEAASGRTITEGYVIERRITYEEAPGDVALQNRYLIPWLGLIISDGVGVREIRVEITSGTEYDWSPKYIRWQESGGSYGGPRISEIAPPCYTAQCDPTAAFLRDIGRGGTHGRSTRIIGKKLTVAELKQFSGWFGGGVQGGVLDGFAQIRPRRRGIDRDATEVYLTFSDETGTMDFSFPTFKTWRGTLPFQGRVRIRPMVLAQEPFDVYMIELWP